jgi:hypothetical protein
MVVSYVLKMAEDYLQHPSRPVSAGQERKIRLLLRRESTMAAPAPSPARSVHSWAGVLETIFRLDPVV